MAIILWQLLLKDRFALLPDFITFLQQSYDDNKPIPKDTWNLVLDFAQTVHPNLDNFDADGNLFFQFRALLVAFI